MDHREQTGAFTEKGTRDEAEGYNEDGGGRNPESGKDEKTDLEMVEGKKVEGFVKSSVARPGALLYSSL